MNKLVFVIFVLFAFVSTLCANGMNSAQMRRDIRRQAFSLLIARAKDKHPKVERAQQIVEKELPTFFTENGLAELFSVAALSKKTATKLKITEQLKSSRKTLKSLGHYSKLKNKSFRKAILYLARAKVFADFIKQDKETIAFTAKVRDAAIAKACAANMKMLAGAAEMYHMDHNEHIGLNQDINQLLLVKEGYLKFPAVCLVSKSQSYKMNEHGAIICKNHGDLGSCKKLGKTGFTEKQLGNLYENNAVFRVTDEILKQHSPDGRGFVNFKK